MSGVRRLLNETALAELENVRISIPNRNRSLRKPKNVEKQNSISEDADKDNKAAEAGGTAEPSEESVKPSIGNVTQNRAEDGTASGATQG